ncbi:carboxy terminal-processing peptidase [Rhodopirellula halodulae]|uniref:carboxy terminal-processing peptidase n=1 Tax=Rhodopirellula halodulae TaxID=2894198 RepID=UPI001E3A4B1B|nr:carboxy terminal-processing peptidase [Rhodopirellula sp. JC737]MCC9655924.1 carboxy terminal-processing peptidase [Rhodopirellula sp. JC737]
MSFRQKLSVALLATVCIGSPQLNSLSFAQEQADRAATQQSPPPQPTSRDKVIAKLISNLMPTQHVSGKQLNDEISQRALDLFLESFDPMKLYFLQSDVDEFKRYSNVIDDQVRLGDLSLAYYIYGRFTQRVDERVAVVMELLDGEFDFTRDEQIIIDRDATQYARNADEARDRWRRQIKLALLDLRNEKSDKDEDAENAEPEKSMDDIMAEAKDQLRRRYARYARRWKQTSSDDLLELFLTSVTNGYDPHSTYMSPATLEDFAISMRLNLDGIGASLGEKDGTTVVRQIIPGGAADSHGKLKPDDVIVAVGQDLEGPMVDIIEMPLKEVVKLIRGRAGSTVRLAVRPGGTGNEEILKIVRARIELEDSAARGEIIEHELPGQGKVKLGYINLPSFYMDMEAARRNERDYRSSTRDVERILYDFKEQNVGGVVLDLSRNGGGSLTEAISLTGLFIDRGPVVQVKNSDGSVQQYSDDQGGTVWDGPLVVVTSKLSASASEIFAGAIQDYHRGIIVGDPATHGKGTVQTLRDLGQDLFGSNTENYGALKVTLQQFYLPDGESTQLRGVEADLVLPSMTSKLPVAEGDLEYALEFDKVPLAKHNLYAMTPDSLINQLRINSANRVQQDKEFAELMRRIELYVREKDQKSISLNEEDFLRRRAEREAQTEAEEEELDEVLNNDEIFRDTYYNKEVMNVAHEYVNGLRSQNLAVAK